MLSGIGLSGSDRVDKVSKRLDTSREAEVSNKHLLKYVFNFFINTCGFWLLEYCIQRSGFHASFSLIAKQMNLVVSYPFWTHNQDSICHNKIQFC